MEISVVDGVIGSGAESDYGSCRNVTRTSIPATAHFALCHLIVASRSPALLDTRDEAALMPAAAAFDATRRTVAEAEQGRTEQERAELGATISDLTEDQRAAMAEKVRAALWPAVLGDSGADWGRTGDKRSSTRSPRLNRPTHGRPGRFPRRPGHS